VEENFWDLSSDKDIDYNKLMYRTLLSKDNDSSYVYLMCSAIGDLEVSEWIARNDLDASGITSLLKAEYLVYGVIRKESNFFESEIRLYNSKIGKTIKEFSHIYMGSDRKQFIKEIAYKIESVVFGLLGEEKKGGNNNLLNDLLKQKEEKEKKKRKEEAIKNFRLYNHIGIYNQIGYHILLNQEWQNFVGVIGVSTGIKIIRLPMIYSWKDNIGIYLRPGLLFSYILSVTKIEYVQSYLNTFLFVFPLEGILSIKNKYNLYLSCGIQARIDYFHQNLYNRRMNNVTAQAFGWFVGTGFEYDINDNFSVGNVLYFNFSSYNRLYADFKIDIYLLIKFKKNENKMIQFKDININNQKGKKM